MKPKTCKACRCKFTPSRPLQTVCGPQCAADVAAKQRKAHAVAKAKEDRKKDRERKAASVSLPVLKKRVERAVNTVCRERDAEDPCISCKTYDTIAWQAGHFIPVGRSQALRYDYKNIHKQCEQCNCRKGGNATNYEINLIAKIGQEEVDRLKREQRTLKTWEREELLAIEKRAKEDLKELRNARR